MNKKEKEISNELCIDFLDNHTVNIKSISENNNYKFSFDRAFDFNTKQKEIYEFAAKNIIDSVFEGFNGTIFAYGQTSSGKTFTMQGVIDDPLLEGIIPRIIRYIFERIEVLSDKNLQFVVRVSILEIYNEKIRDLLETNKTNLQIREDKSRGIFIEDLSEYQIGSSNKVMDIMKKGLDNRAVNSTNMNEQSSRSHSIVILNIIQNNIKDLSAKVGKLYLVDLAGSEKISKTGAKGQVLDEAKSINKSLTTLGLVIKALTDSKQGHIPYRESKLTRVLQESLGGNSKTCLIITCSPSIYNEAETLSTLRFGMRAKKVKNKAKINKEFSIQELKCEVNKLEGQLGKFKNRIDILEDYLMQKGIPIPSDDLKINSFNKPIINGSLPNNKKNDPHKSIKNDILNRTIIHEEAIREINNQYIDVLNIVNSLENEKLELEIELTKARDRIKDIHLEQVKKEILFAELEEMKVVSEQRVEEMEKEINRMKKHIEINKQNLTIIEDNFVDSNDNLNDKNEKDIFVSNNFAEVKEKPQNVSIRSLIKTYDDTNLLSTNLISIVQNVDLQMSDQILSNNNCRTNNYSPFSSASSFNSITIDPEAIKELLDKLKEISISNPELNNIINTYEAKQFINKTNPFNLNNSNSQKYNILNKKQINTNSYCNTTSNLNFSQDSGRAEVEPKIKTLTNNTKFVTSIFSPRNNLKDSYKINPEEASRYSLNNLTKNDFYDSDKKDESVIRKRDSISDKAQIVINDDSFRKRNLSMFKDIFQNRKNNK